MHTPLRTFPVAFILALAVTCLPVAAQTVIDTIQVGSRPANLAVNPVTNKIYVANQGGHSIIAYRVARDGRLSPTSFRLRVGSPACIVFSLSRS